MAMDKGARRSRAAVIRRNLEHLLPEEERPRMRMLWGTVQSDGRVLLDNDSEPLPAETPALAPLTDGKRVAVLRYGKTLVILGPLGGESEIDASQVISGVFDPDRIPQLTSDHITPVITALGTANLDDITDPGVYAQNTTANASTARNYPVALAGLLEVQNGSSGTTMVYQRYTVFGHQTHGGRVFNRGRYSGTWSPWRELVRDVDQRPWAMQTGQATVPGGSGTITSVTVTFASGRFTVPPVVMVSAATTVPGTIVQGVAAAGVSTSSVTIYVLRTSSTNTVVNWLAVQATPNSAVG